MTRYLYLHGFASSPASRKAQFFREKLAGAGMELLVPALDQGDFEHLTIGRQLAFVRSMIEGPTVLIGSSLGGLLAALTAVAEPRVERILVLAPAFGQKDLWAKTISGGRERQWAETGWLSLEHYGTLSETRLWWEFVTEAQTHEPYPVPGCPVQIWHGRRDEVVPVEVSREYARRSGAVLHEVEGGHELTEVLDEIWRGARSFVQGTLGG